jgi:cation:H+ antiporter
MVFAALLTLAISTIILSRSSSVVVESAAKLARFFGVGQLAVGMLLIAVSTSLPELSVSIVSSVANQGAIAAGNVFGSNIANILLILGIGAFLYGFKVGKESLPDIALVLLLTTIISVYILFHSQIGGIALGFFEGMLLLLIALWYGWRLLMKKRTKEDGKEPPVTNLTSPLSQSFR